MYADIVAIGTELTSGAKLDTNSQWLSQQLADLGVTVQAHATVADHLPQMVDVLRQACLRSDVVLVTGGLGPTLDDITREAFAELAQVPLELDQPSLDGIRSFFASRKRTMPERNVVQAMFPRGSVPIPNPRGTAPGVMLDLPTDLFGEPKRLIAMPGVPSEMKPMFADHVAGVLRQSGRVIRRATINCFGLGESQCEALLGDLTARDRNPDIGITVHEATITLRITSIEATEAACVAQIAAAREQILAKIGRWVYGEGEAELEDVVVGLLGERGQTLGVVEFGTGGLLTQRITTVPGHSAMFAGGVVLPGHEPDAEVPAAAGRLFNLIGPTVPPLAVERSTPAAEGDAGAYYQQLATAACTAIGCDYALVTSPWPLFLSGASPASMPKSFVALGVKESEKTGAARSGEQESQPLVEEVMHFGDPAIARSRTAKVALNMLRRRLLGIG
jgi:nicotinamide-nucleotide amidase